MLTGNPSPKISATQQIIRKFAAAVTLLGAGVAAACSSAGEDADGHRFPTDKQVVADITPVDKENVVSVHVVADRDGESYLHPDSIVWTFDRGAVIKRKANLADMPDVIVVVGGIARYELVGGKYVFRQFLTTYNEYEGMPTPSRKDLLRYVEQNIDNVFNGREHNILAIQSFDLSSDQPWHWHTPNSFTVPFQFRYRERTSNTTVDERIDTIDLRFYRQSPNDPIHTLLATEAARSIVNTETFNANEIDGMPTLRTKFR